MGSEKSSHHIIKIENEEFDFFKNFTFQQKLSWPREHQENKLLMINKSQTGYIQTPLRRINLPCKYNEIGFQHVFRMYKYVNNFRVNEDAKILDVESSESNTDVIENFLQELKNEMLSGIHRVYERKNIKINSLTGKVDYIKTIANKKMNKFPYVETRKFILSTNSDINKLICGALLRISKIDKYSTESRNILDHFQDVSNPVTKNGQKYLKSITFNSQNERYRNICEYAAVIIDEYNVTDFGRTKGLPSFLINFDSLFESFIIKVLTESIVSSDFIIWKRSKVLGHIGERESGMELRYMPDILFRYRSEHPDYHYKPHSEAVLDCKNKAYSIFSSSDIYQMVSYTSELEAKHGILIYPTFTETQNMTLYLDYERFSPSQINAVFVNIAENNGVDFLNSIEHFKKNLRKILL